MISDLDGGMCSTESHSSLFNGDKFVCSAALTEVCVLLSVILVYLMVTSLCVISGLDEGMCSTECHSSLFNDDKFVCDQRP